MCVESIWALIGMIDPHTILHESSGSDTTGDTMSSVDSPQVRGGDTMSSVDSPQVSGEIPCPQWIVHR